MDRATQDCPVVARARSKTRKKASTPALAPDNAAALSAYQLGGRVVVTASQCLGVKQDLARPRFLEGIHVFVRVVDGQVDVQKHRGVVSPEARDDGWAKGQHLPAMGRLREGGREAGRDQVFAEARARVG